MFKKIKILITFIIAGLILISPIYNSVISGEDTEEENSNANNSIICIDYSFDNFETSEINISDKTYTKFDESNIKYSTYGKIGEPVIPVISARVLLPYGFNLENIEIDTGNTESFKISSPIMPGQEPEFFSNIDINDDQKTDFINVIKDVYNPINSVDNIGNNLLNDINQKNIDEDNSYDDKKLDIIDEDIYTSSNNFPGKFYEISGEYYFRGYKVLILNLYPVQYNPADNMIYSVESLNLKVFTKPIKDFLGIENHRGVYNDVEAIVTMVDNPYTVSTYPTREHHSYEYVIITTENFKNYDGAYNLILLLEAKKYEGLNGTIVTVEEIKDEYEGSDIQEKIRNFIKYAYNNWDTEYVLLAGDTEIIPARYLYCDVGAPGGEMASQIPSDLYYSCLDGSFNSDSDMYWGELDDGGDIGEYYTFQSDGNPITCGDGVCSPGETEQSCPEDCSGGLTVNVIFDPAHYYTCGTHISVCAQASGGEGNYDFTFFYSDGTVRTVYNVGAGCGGCMACTQHDFPSIGRVNCTVNAVDSNGDTGSGFAIYTLEICGGDDGQGGNGGTGNSITNNLDLMAEVYVGRAPIDSELELENFVRKTLLYESNIWGNNDYLKNVLNVGENVFSNPDTFGGMYLNELIDTCENNGYNTSGIPSSNYTIDKLYDWYISDEWSVSALIDKINKKDGIHILNHLGHGNEDKMGRLSNGYINSLSNFNLFFAYSQTCIAGSFDNYKRFGESNADAYFEQVIDDCNAEKLTVETQNGAFAAIMNSRYGLGQKGGTDGPSQRFHREFWDAFYGENISSIGHANQDSKEDNLHLIDNNYIRYCFYELNLFGDPSVCIKGVPGDPGPIIPTENVPPFKPELVVPEDGINGIDIVQRLKIKVFDFNMDDMDITFYDAFDDSVIRKVTGVSSGEEVKVLWFGLDYNTEYSWYVVADDSAYQPEDRNGTEFTTVSDVFSFKTIADPQAPAVTWWNSSWSYRKPVFLATDEVDLSQYDEGFNLELKVFYDEGMQADFDDLRFISYDDDITILNYYVKEIIEGSYITVVIGLDDCPVYKTLRACIWMYYGNDNADSGSSSDWFILDEPVFLWGTVPSGKSESSRDTKSWGVKTVTDSEGNIIVAGQRRANLWGTGCNKNFRDPWYLVVKTDPYGNLLWEHEFACHPNSNQVADDGDFIVDVVVDSEDNIIVTGTSDDDGDMESDNKPLWWDNVSEGADPNVEYLMNNGGESFSGYDFWTIKINGSTGFEIWDQRVGGKNGKHYTILIEDDSVVDDIINGNISWSELNASQYSLNANMGPQYYAKAVEVDSNDNVYVVGNKKSSVSSLSDVLLEIYDSEGEEREVKYDVFKPPVIETFANVLYSGRLVKYYGAATDMLIDEDDNVIIAGALTDTHSGSVSNYENEGFIAKFSSFEEAGVSVDLSIFNETYQMWCNEYDLTDSNLSNFNNIKFKITVKNEGDFPLTDISVNSNYIDVLSYNFDSNIETYCESDNGLRWIFDTINPNESKEIIYSATVNKSIKDMYKEIYSYNPVIKQEEDLWYYVYVNATTVNVVANSERGSLTVDDDANLIIYKTKDPIYLIPKNRGKNDPVSEIQEIVYEDETSLRNIAFTNSGLNQLWFKTFDGGCDLRISKSRKGWCGVTIDTKDDIIWEMDFDNDGNIVANGNFGVITLDANGNIISEKMENIQPCAIITPGKNEDTYEPSHDFYLGSSDVVIYTDIFIYTEPDQTVELVGSDSFDLDGEISSYKWYYNGELICENVNCSFEVPDLSVILAMMNEEDSDANKNDNSKTFSCFGADNTVNTHEPVEPSGEIADSDLPSLIVKLVVSDNNGITDEDIIEIQVIDTAMIKQNNLKNIDNTNYQGKTLSVILKSEYISEPNQEIIFNATIKKSYDVRTINGHTIIPDDRILGVDFCDWNFGCDDCNIKSEIVFSHTEQINETQGNDTLIVEVVDVYITNASWTYNEKGIYTVTVTLINTSTKLNALFLNTSILGFASTTARIFGPGPEPPVAIISKDNFKTCLGETITFDGTSSFDYDGIIRYIEWDFGDGTTTKLLMNPIHFYEKEGEYIVTLKVWDNDNLVGIDKVKVIINGWSNRVDDGITPRSHGFSGGRVTVNSLNNRLLTPYKAMSAAWIDSCSNYEPTRVVEIDKNYNVKNILYTEEDILHMSLTIYQKDVFQDIITTGAKGCGWCNTEGGLYISKYGYYDLTLNQDIEPRIGVLYTNEGTCPYLSITPCSFNFGNMCIGDIDSTSFEVWNSGTGILSYSISELCNWVHIDVTNGESSGEHDIINVNIDSCGLSLGSHSCNININSDFGNEVFTFYVNIVEEVVEESVLSFNPSSRDLGALPIDYQISTSFEIWNSGFGLLNYSLSESCDFVSIDIIEGNSSGEDDTITVEVDTSGLSDGSFSCNVNIVSNGGNDSYNVIFDVDSDPCNSAPVISNELPINSSINVSIDNSVLSVDISDPESNIFDWSIQSNPDIGSNIGVGENNGTKSCSISELMYNTTYTWFVNATDIGSGMTTSKVFVFTIEVNNSDDEPDDDDNISIEIIKPTENGLYVFNEFKRDSLMTIILGNIDIIAKISGNTTVASNVIFYVDNVVLDNITFNSSIEQYSSSFNDKVVGFHSIKAEIFDSKGNVLASDELENVLIFYFGLI